jgi:hypothetical protein
MRVRNRVAVMSCGHALLKRLVQKKISCLCNALRNYFRSALL